MKKYIIVLVFILFSQPLTGQANSFSDVQKNYWAYPSIQFVVEQGLVSGYEDRTFRPNRTVTQGHFVKMFANLLYMEDVQEAENRLQKQMKSSPYIAYYEVLQSKGYGWLLKGKPNDPLSRAYVSYFIYQAITNEMRIGEEAYKLLKELGMTTATSYKEFNPSGSLTRAHAAGFLHRFQTNYLAVQPKFPVQKGALLETMYLTDTIQINYTNDEKMYVYEDDVLVAMFYGQRGAGLGNVYIGKQLNKSALSCPYGLKEQGYKNGTVICKVSPFYTVTYYVDHIGGEVLFIVQQFKDGASALFNYKEHFDELSLEDVRALNVILTNQTRAKFGAVAVQQEDTLTEVAQYHSEDMAYANFYAHKNLRGQSPSDRAAMFGYHYPYVAEIIFLSPNNTFEAHTGWMNSPGHRKILIGPTYRMIGSGIAAQYNQAGEVVNLYYTDNFTTK